MKVLNLALTIVLLLWHSPAWAADCKEISREVPLQSTLATANTWDNVRGNAGSLKVESQKLLSRARKELLTSKAPEDLCPKECHPDSKPQIVFRSIPNKFLSDYSDREHCASLSEQTKLKPLAYSGKQFDSVDSLNSWIGDFSQGSGTEGKDLYKKCDGDCSPQYEYRILDNASAMNVDAVVLCGQARDKDDNQFKLSVSYRWQCL